MLMVGRKIEQKALRDAYAAPTSQFVAVYGRRRVGKTFLVRETFRGELTFHHTGVYGGGIRRQLGAFCKSIVAAGLDELDQPRDWMDAFELLKRLLGPESDQKKVVFIDELSWMDAPRSDLVPALEWFWNGWASARRDILLIVCASATSWMLNKIIHNKGGLYNRLNRRIALKPFTLLECEELLASRGVVMNRYQILECYMVLGGVPYYWEFIEPGMSSSQAIDALFFAAEAPLRDEYDHLFSSIFSRPKNYLAIVQVLTGNKAGLTRGEIAQRAGVSDSGHLSTRLAELESCGFVRAYRSYGKRRRGMVYQLVDNFTLFYHKFLRDRPTDERFWANREGGSARNAWCGLAFERVCLEHVPQIKSALGISGVLTDVTAWSCEADPDRGVEGSQVDLLIARRDHVINLCEMKYADRPYAVTKDVDKALTRKLSDFRAVTGTRAALHPTLVTPYGAAGGKYAGSFQSVVTAEDLFA